MHKLYELKDKLMNELEDYADNGKFSKDDVEAIKYTASAIDHICNIVEDEEYSGAMGGMYDGGSYEGSYRGGSYEGGSYARGGNRGRGGRSYARGRGRNARRDSIGRYSSEGYSRASDGIVMELRDLMDDAPDDRIRQEIQSLIHKVEKM